MLQKLPRKTINEKYLQQVIHNPESLYEARPVDSFGIENILEKNKELKKISEGVLQAIR